MKTIARILIVLVMASVVMSGVFAAGYIAGVQTSGHLAQVIGFADGRSSADGRFNQAQPFQPPQGGPNTGQTQRPETQPNTGQGNNQRPFDRQDGGRGQEDFRGHNDRGHGHRRGGGIIFGFIKNLFLFGLIMAAVVGWSRFSDWRNGNGKSNGGGPKTAVPLPDDDEANGHSQTA